MMVREIWKEVDRRDQRHRGCCINGLRKKVEIPGTRPLIHTVRALGMRSGRQNRGR